MLIKLMLGLHQFRKKPFELMKELFEQLSNQQNPETLFITCSDSRIIPSLITQAVPGDLFSIRNIGNIIPPTPSNSSETAAIEYALNVLQIKDIIICGHSNCGAMKGLLTPGIEQRLPVVASWLHHSRAVLKEIQEARNDPQHDHARELEMATKKNIVLQMENLKTYPLFVEKTERKEVTIHGWYYELETGQVFIYEPDLNEFINLESALKRALESRKIKIISGLCMSYLQHMTPPKTEKEYHQLMELITRLQESILPIWEFIKVAAKEQLWKELGGFYSTIEDGEFITMLESSLSIKLTDLEEFRKSIPLIENSHSPLLSASIFMKQTVEMVATPRGNKGAQTQIAQNSANL